MSRVTGGVLAGVALALAAIGDGASRMEAAEAASAVVVWAVGDLCLRRPSNPGCDDVARRIAADGDRDAVLVLGDGQYENGSLEEYRTFYEPRMGRHKAITRPAPGNHDYGTPDAAGYFDYWRQRAGVRGRGWHATTLGSWRVIATNSNCGYVGGCGPGSAQAAFVAAELDRAGACELVFGHHPAFTDGPANGTSQGRDLLRVAYAGHAELYLAGHVHNYQRFAPRRPDGDVDRGSGVRTFVVGTGGGALEPLSAPRRSEARQAHSLGALRLTLSATGWSTRFVAIDGRVLDTASGSCRS